MFFKDTDDAEFIEELTSVLGDEVKEVDGFIVVFKYKVSKVFKVFKFSSFQDFKFSGFQDFQVFNNIPGSQLLSDIQIFFYKNTAPSFYNLHCLVMNHGPPQP